jgi:Domain of unknown function (DUF5615)
MKLLLDEMYAPAIAEQLRARGHDAVSVHDAAYRALQGEPDEKVWATAVADNRALVSENVQDFRRPGWRALPRSGRASTARSNAARRIPRLQASVDQMRP